ncbi:MAG: hypothetical protein FWF82_01835 [Oscillospiraceae bacterium]|nr:hypothetical protein [Oscillospiraceae bacterium]
MNNEQGQTNHADKTTKKKLINNKKIVIIAIASLCVYYLIPLMYGAGNPSKHVIFRNEYKKYVAENFDSEMRIPLSEMRYRKMDGIFVGKVYTQDEDNPYFNIYDKDGVVHTNYFDYVWQKQAKEILNEYLDSDIKVSTFANNTFNDGVHGEFLYNTEYIGEDVTQLPHYSEIKETMTPYLKIELKIPRKFTEEDYEEMYDIYLFIQENTPSLYIVYDYKNCYIEFRRFYHNMEYETEISDIDEFKENLEKIKYLFK